MRVAIAGASGFIGSALRVALQGAGHTVLTIGAAVRARRMSSGIPRIVSSIVRGSTVATRS
ncbi:MAG: NAD-dependent epimerase/dehydratase family protein [Gemmatimonadaceae bacterium]